MHPKDLLAPSVLAFETQAISQAVAFERIGSLLEKLTGAAAAEIAEALHQREREGSTGFGNGFAIPHGRLHGLGGIHGALLKLSQPIMWNAVDGVPVDLVFALVGPEAASADHLKALASVSRALKGREFAEKLRGANDADAMWAVIAQDWRLAA